jgi:type II secretory pathway component PulK
MEKSTGAIVGIVFLKFAAGTVGIIMGIVLVCLVVSIIGGIVWYIKNKLNHRAIRKEQERQQAVFLAREAQRMTERDAQ